MKKLLIALLFPLLSAAQHTPKFHALRYDDDFRYMARDTSGDWYPKLKFTRLSEKGNTYVSFGGDIRLQYFRFKNEDLGDAPQDDDGFILNRYLFHADFHAGDRFRFFVQFQGSMASGRRNPNLLEQNPLDWHQAIADWKHANKNSGVTLRIGRQEMWYGSQRLIAVREFPNSRLAFDAARVMVKTSAIASDAFFALPVANKEGIFDDSPQAENRLWGSYTTISRVPYLKNVDLYYLGLRKQMAEFANASGREQRHTFGTRIWNQAKNFGYDVEAVYQSGKINDAKISAWTLSSYLTYRFSDFALQPEFGLKAEVISGDSNPADAKLGTFNPLFPRGAYFGLAGIIGPSNLYDLHPEVSLMLSKTIDFGLDLDLFWRFSLHDGIYAPNVSVIYAGVGDERFIGTQLAGNISWQPNSFFGLKAEATWFDAGPFAKEAGTGNDILFVGVTSQFKF